MDTSLPNDPQFIKNYTKHCKYLKLNGLQPKTIDAYSRAIRRIGNYFNCRLNNLTMDQPVDYFTDLLESVLEYGQARSVRPEIFLHQSPEQNLAGYPLD